MLPGHGQRHNATTPVSLPGQLVPDDRVPPTVAYRSCIRRGDIHPRGCWCWPVPAVNFRPWPRFAHHSQVLRHCEPGPRARQACLHQDAIVDRGVFGGIVWSGRRWTTGVRTWGQALSSAKARGHGGPPRRGRQANQQEPRTLLAWGWLRPQPWPEPCTLDRTDHGATSRKGGACCLRRCPRARRDND